MNLLILRFANIFKLTNVSVDNIKSVVKRIKSETSIDLDCNYEDTLLEDDNKLSLVKAVEQKLQIKSSKKKLETFTKELLKPAAELFLYLNSCPDIWFRFWSNFYTELFLTESTDQIILTLNRMMKSMNTQVRDGNIRAGKLLKKISTKLSLRYKDIQRLVRPDQVQNVNLELQTANINISDNGKSLVNCSNIIVCVH